jgi:hypothetical protein
MVRDANNVIKDKVCLGFNNIGYWSGQVSIIPNEDEIVVKIEVYDGSEKVSNIEESCDYDEMKETAIDLLDRADRVARRKQSHDDLRKKWTEAKVEFRDQ